MSEVNQPYIAMARNNAWANATFYAVLSKLPSGAFTAERPGFFPSLCKTLNHIYEIDLYYLDALEQGGRGYKVFECDEVTDPETLGVAQAAADNRLIGFCEALTAKMLGATRQTQRPDGPVAERVDALLLHLFQHQIHHRGQAHVQLQLAGVHPPQLDEFHLDFDRAPSARAFQP